MLHHQQYARDCALFLHSLGLNVFPCYDGRNNQYRWIYKNGERYERNIKSPLVKFTQGRISEWTLKNFATNVTSTFGVEMGVYKGKYLVGLDCDNKHGNNGVQKAFDLFGINEKTTFTVETAHGNGRHYYFLTDENIENIRNSVSLFPGIDIRGYHGYLIIPGSTIIEGGAYKKYRTLSTHFEPAPIPPALLSAVHEAQRKKREEESRKVHIPYRYRVSLSTDYQMSNSPLVKSIVERGLNRIRYAPVGVRNTTLYNTAIYLFTFSPRYISGDHLASALFQASPLPAGEKLATIASAEGSNEAQKKRDLATKYPTYSKKATNTRNTSYTTAPYNEVIHETTYNEPENTYSPAMY